MISSSHIMNMAYGDRKCIGEDPKLAITRGELPNGAFEIYKSEDGIWSVYIAKIEAYKAMAHSGQFKDRDAALAHLDAVREEMRAECRLESLKISSNK